MSLFALPRLRLAHLPTPVEPLPRLTAALGGGLELWVKRDDQTGLAFGGNKTRKLEYLMAEAQAHGARMVITAGAAQSNHCRQTAAAAARLGLECLLVLVGPPGDPHPTGNRFLMHLFGARFRWTTPASRDEDLQRAFQEAWAEGKRPYLIPYGGSSPVGAAAYAYALEELLVQQDFHPDVIVLASSSGGTQAGLVAGARLLGYRGRIIGISVDAPAEVLRSRVAHLASEVLDRLRAPGTIAPEEVEVVDTYAEPGYGVLTEREEEAILLAARTEGLLVDPVYTGRALAGLIDLVRQGAFAPGTRVLFWHTGGTPALLAEPYRAQVLDAASRYNGDQS